MFCTSSEAVHRWMVQYSSFSRWRSRSVLHILNPKFFIRLRNSLDELGRQRKMSNALSPKSATMKNLKINRNPLRTRKTNRMKAILMTMARMMASQTTEVALTSPSMRWKIAFIGSKRRLQSWSPTSTISHFTQSSILLDS